MSGFNQTLVDAPFLNKDVQVVLNANTLNTTEAATKVVKANSLFINMPSTVADPIVNGSVLMQTLGAKLTDSFGQIKRNAQVVGTIDYLSFLSHLCGDEGYMQNGKPTVQFLSHLCGDEVSAAMQMCHQYFLSHLCGDEDTDKD